MGSHGPFLVLLVVLGLSMFLFCLEEKLVSIFKSASWAVGDSVAEGLPNMQQASGSIPNTTGG